MQRPHRMVFAGACIDNNPAHSSVPCYKCLINPNMYHVSKGSTRMLEFLSFYGSKIGRISYDKKKKKKK